MSRMGVSNPGHHSASCSLHLHNTRLKYKMLTLIVNVCLDYNLSTSSYPNAVTTCSSTPISNLLLLMLIISIHKLQILITLRLINTPSSSEGKYIQYFCVFLKNMWTNSSRLYTTMQDNLNIRTLNLLIAIAS